MLSGLVVVVKAVPASPRASQARRPLSTDKLRLVAATVVALAMVDRVVAVVEAAAHMAAQPQPAHKEGPADFPRIKRAQAAEVLVKQASPVLVTVVLAGAVPPPVLQARLSLVAEAVVAGTRRATGQAPVVLAAVVLVAMHLMSLAAARRTSVVAAVVAGVSMTGPQ
jgi:hypothetical protein